MNQKASYKEPVLNTHPAQLFGNLHVPGRYSTISDGLSKELNKSVLFPHTRRSSSAVNQQNKTKTDKSTSTKKETQQEKSSSSKNEESTSSDNTTNSDESDSSQNTTDDSSSNENTNSDSTTETE